MSKLALTTIALSITAILSGCQSLIGDKNEEIVAEKQYESAPDLTNAEVLTANKNNNGTLVSDANDNFIDPNAKNQAAYDPVNNLEKAESSPNTQIGAADPHLSIQEFALSNDAYSHNLVFDASANNTVGNTANGQNQSENLYNNNEIITGQNNQNDFSQKSADDYAAPVTSVNEFSSDTSRCSVSLNSEASGIARALIKDLIARLRAESGTIFVAPTIVDQEYTDCVKNLELAIQDGLVGNAQFQLTAGNMNLQNIISQNIGSATILPSLIHQCRAVQIPYLVISQVRRTGDKAALSIRIVRTEDGITLSQTYRRLSQ